MLLIWYQCLIWLWLQLSVVCIFLASLQCYGCNSCGLFVNLYVSLLRLSLCWLWMRFDTIGQLLIAQLFFLLLWLNLYYMLFWLNTALFLFYFTLYVESLLFFYFILLMKNLLFQTGLVPYDRSIPLPLHELCDSLLLYCAHETSLHAFIHCEFSLLRRRLLNLCWACSVIEPAIFSFNFVFPILIIKQHTIVSISYIKNDSEAFVKLQRYFGRCDDILLDVPIDVVGIHIDSHSDLIGLFPRRRVSSKSPACSFTIFFQFTVSDHSVAAVVGDEKLVFSFLLLMGIWAVVKWHNAYFDHILGRVDDCESEVVLSLERQYILAQDRRPWLMMRVFDYEIVLYLVVSSKSVEITIADSQLSLFYSLLQILVDLQRINQIFICLQSHLFTQWLQLYLFSSMDCLSQQVAIRSVGLVYAQVQRSAEVPVKGLMFWSRFGDSIINMWTLRTYSLLHCRLLLVGVPKDSLRFLEIFLVEASEYVLSAFSFFGSQG